MSNLLFSEETMKESPLVINAMKAVGKYLMRAFTHGHDPMYDAVLTISSVGVQIPLFFLRKVTDDYSTTILSNNPDGLKFKNHHYTQTQTLKIVSDITSSTLKENPPGPGDKYTVTPHKTSEHAILKEIGVLATI